MNDGGFTYRNCCVSVSLHWFHSGSDMPQSHEIRIYVRDGTRTVHVAEVLYGSSPMTLGPITFGSKKVKLCNMGSAYYECV